MDDWRTQIAVAHLVKARLAELDVEGLWPQYLPELAATSQELARAETHVGEKLDERYRSFLSYANGWKAFYHSVDLFGTADLISDQTGKMAGQLLETLEPLHQLIGLSIGDVLPIAVSRDSIDIFVITRRHTRRPGEVIWLAGQVIDTFPNFDEYFLAMIDYNRLDVKEFEQ